jgi:hypothetical protein
MSLFNSQTIFSILFALLIGFILYYYISYKYRLLEFTVREQAKLLQSVIMSMNANNENIMSMVQNRNQDQNEIIKDSVHRDINRFNQVNSNNELIDVSDESESSSDDDSGSESSSDDDSASESSNDSGSENEYEENEQSVDNNTTKKILFTGGNDSHPVEHLDGPDVKVIELRHPLYPTNENKEYKNNDDDGEDEEDDDEDEEEDEDSESESLSGDNDEQEKQLEDHNIHEIHDIQEIHEIKENISEVISLDNSLDHSLDNLSIKTVFKNKESNESKEVKESTVDYNSMNVQTLRQHLRNKLATEGTHMNDASINKLNKKELIKHLA